MNCARLFEHANGFPSFHAAIVAADETLEQSNRPPPVGDKATDEKDQANWGLTCLTEELCRNCDKSEAEVFIDLGEDPSIEADGLLDGGGEKNGEPGLRPPSKTKARSKPRGEVLTMLNDIFEADATKETNAGTITSTTTTEHPRSDDDDLCLNPTRFVDDDEVEMIGELGAGAGVRKEK